MVNFSKILFFFLLCFILVLVVFSGCKEKANLKNIESDTPDFVDDPLKNPDAAENKADEELNFGDSDE